MRIRDEYLHGSDLTGVVKKIEVTIGTGNNANKSVIKYIKADSEGGVVEVPIGDITGKAATASKLDNTSAIGSKTNPVYFTANGVPSACTYFLNATVPAGTKNQVLYYSATNTLGTQSYTTLTSNLDVFTVATASADGKKGLVPAPAANQLGKGNFFLRADGVWTVIENKTAALNGTATSLVTTGEKYNWNSAYNWYNTMTSGDTDGVINKWKEVEAFLANYGDSSTLAAELAKLVTLSTDQTITGVKTFSEVINGSITGNAGTANKLKNTVNINGVAFDGSADITITAVATGGNSDTVGGYSPSDFLLKAEHETFESIIATALTDLDKRKIEASDIPSSLPANGGNADTVDGKHLYTRNLGVNGTSWTFASTANSNPTTDIYAPTGAGTSGQILKSTGGTPTWINQSDISAGYATSAGDADTVDGKHASSFYQYKYASSNQDSIYDLRWNYGAYNKGDFNGTYKDEYPTYYGRYLALTSSDKNSGALMFIDTPTSNALGHIYVRTRGAGDGNTTYSELGTLAYLTDNVASADYATSAGSVDWDGVTNKPSSFTPSSHTHPYLPLSGGTVTGTSTCPLNIKSGNVNYSTISFNTSEDNSIVFGYKYIASDTIPTMFLTNKNGWDYEYHLLHSGNYNNYAPTLDGTGATGTWGINISGNATSATSLGSGALKHMCSLYTLNNYNAYKITTDWHKSYTIMPTINIRGYAYGSVRTIDCDIVMYHWNNAGKSYSLTNKGSYPIKVWQAIENDVQVFYINPGEYYGMFNVFVYGGISTDIFTNWSMITVDEVSGTEIPLNPIATSITGNAATASSVDWSGVTNRPTDVSAFYNDAGYLTSHAYSYGSIDIYDVNGAKKTSNNTVSASVNTETLRLQEGANISITATNSGDPGSDNIKIAVTGITSNIDRNGYGQLALWRNGAAEVSTTLQSSTFNELLTVKAGSGIDFSGLNKTANNDSWTISAIPYNCAITLNNNSTKSLIKDTWSADALSIYLTSNGTSGGTSLAAGTYALWIEDRKSASGTPNYYSGTFTCAGSATEGRLDEIALHSSMATNADTNAPTRIFVATQISGTSGKHVLRFCSLDSSATNHYLTVKVNRLI